MINKNAFMIYNFKGAHSFLETIWTKVSEERDIQSSLHLQKLSCIHSSNKGKNTEKG